MKRLMRAYAKKKQAELLINHCDIYKELVMFPPDSHGFAIRQAALSINQFLSDFWAAVDEAVQ
jgi:hypothetical protein